MILRFVLLRLPVNLDKILIAIIGDSTVEDFPTDHFLRGWGQMIPKYFNEKVEIRNFAVSGQSSKSFKNENRWDKTLRINPDYIFIQFGHNDSKDKGDGRYASPNTDYRDYLQMYIDDCRKRKIKPILITPPERLNLAYNGSVVMSLLEYANAMKEVCFQNGVPLIDLHRKSVCLYEKLGEKGCIDFFPEGDHTHFVERGADMMAQLIVEELRIKTPYLIPYLK